MYLPPADLRRSVRPLAIVFVIASLSILGCGGNAKPSNGVPATSSSAAIPPELIQKVEELIKKNKEYIGLAETIMTSDDFKKNADALSSIDQQCSSLVEDIMIGEAKLSAGQKAEFNSKFFDGLAKPTVEEKRRQSARVKALIR
jgi:hypothetical protein